MQTISDDKTTIYDDFFALVSRICTTTLLIFEWLLVIAALTYVAERYGSGVARLSSYILLLAFAIYVILPPTKWAMTRASGGFLAGALSALFGFSAALTGGFFLAAFVDDVVQSNYEITTESGCDCDAGQDAANVSEPDLVHGQVLPD